MTEETPKPKAVRASTLLRINEDSTSATDASDKKVVEMNESVKTFIKTKLDKDQTGDVHPEDILEVVKTAIQERKSKKKFRALVMVLAVGFLFLLVANMASTIAILSLTRKLDEDNGALVSKSTGEILATKPEGNGGMILMMDAFRDGVSVTQIQTEHKADEIAAALHEEMPWMAPATEEVWLGLRRSFWLL